MKRKEFHNIPSEGSPAKAIQRRCARAVKDFKALDRHVEALREAEYRRMSGKEVQAEVLRLLSDIGDDLDALWESVGAARAAAGNLVNDSGRRNVSPENRTYGAAYLGDPVWERSYVLACPACRTLVRIGPMEGEYYCPRCDRLVENPVEDPYEKRNSSKE